MHGLSISPGRQSQTVPQRSRGALAAAVLAVVVDDPAFEPPHPARATPTSAAKRTAIEARAGDGIIGCRPTLAPAASRGREPSA